ncbi:hypothetical protein COCCADRAFT_105539, partial [Bipolaris zeicola 26-R-13]
PRQDYLTRVRTPRLYGHDSASYEGRKGMRWYSRTSWSLRCLSPARTHMLQHG